MTHLALTLLLLSVGAEVSGEGAASAEAATSGQDAVLPGQAPEPAPLAKPPESDIEVLSEVPDLEESKDSAAGWYDKAFSEPVRILALPTARTTRRGSFEFIIDHRASSPIYNKDSKHPFSDMWNNFLGLDSSLEVGLGLRYGVIDNLDVGIYRAASISATDTYEFDARYRALTQNTAGLDIAVRTGLTWFSQPNAADAHGIFGQLLATRLLLGRILISGGLLYHSNSTNDTKYNQDRAWSTAGAIGVEARLAARVALDAELVSCMWGYCSKNPAFSGGVKYLTSRHTFALVCSNTQFIAADGYVTNTSRQWSKLVLGFNITREY
jgi:hypothetical protein